MSGSWFCGAFSEIEVLMLDDLHWKEFASFTTAKYNRQPRASTHKSPFERRWGAQPPSPPIDALRDLLQTSRRPSAETFPFPVGSSVLYHHPDHPRAKLAPLYTSVTVLQRIKIDAKHRRSAVPIYFVNTEKHVEEGSWKYKSRVVTDSTPFFDRHEGVTTSCATASQSAMRIALAMAFAHSDFDPHEIIVADVKTVTAYLTALRSDSLYVHPPKDHPDYGKFLWLLNRTLYGLRDSGNLWDRSRNKTLTAVGWVPSSVRGMWWK
uniref:Reverse transcriptase Ty1/copia-type domain-containing protein n=1 Tax=Chromera velia CCMP2878 TaxID=1169474 RepID=A0A0G4I982_9ALVE|eukprot:Cvel_12165.t1-p1 / transcript=Cvel_12165.t1 / gene=Cvel_12165 / organism=Chromera_velia_CCMP2878 / gene_product=hypothetical protein / transcript_product=hypothetical protein / location=Cvel_scaffold785:5693-8643(+) / protein_length=264 / sequence_SO=supercontig / SO=protein_coding / is_pseudo=false